MMIISEEKEKSLSGLALFCLKREKTRFTVVLSRAFPFQQYFPVGRKIFDLLPESFIRHDQPAEKVAGASVDDAPAVNITDKNSRRDHFFIDPLPQIRL